MFPGIGIDKNKLIDNNEIIFFLNTTPILNWIISMFSKTLKNLVLCSFSIQTFFPSNEKFKTHFRSRVYSSKAVNDSKKKILKNFFDSTIKINKQIIK